MRYGFTFFLLTLITFSNIYGQAPGLSWFKKAGNSESDAANAIAVTRSGDIYVTGEFNQNIIFDPEVSAENAGTFDMFLTKLSNSGMAQWVKSAGGTVQDRAYGIVADDNYVYVTGEFYKTATFEDTTVISTGKNVDAFFAKYNNSGKLEWLRTGKHANKITGYDIIQDASKNLIAIGFYVVNIDDDPRAFFDDKEITTNGLNDIFIVKYDNSGEVLWAKTAGGPYGGEYGKAVECDREGNIYVTGYAADSALFGNIVTRSRGNVDIFLAKYDPDGNVLWAKTSGGENNDYGQGLAVDPQGNVYLTGSFTSSAIFDTATISGGLGEIFVAKYNSQGNLLWVRSAGGTSSDAAAGITADNRGCFVSGRFKSTAKFGLTELTSSNGSEDIFVAHYDTEGNLVWVKQIGGNDNDRGLSITTDHVGNLYLCGSFKSSSVTLENGSIFQTNGAEDLFIAKFGNEPVPVELASFNYSVSNTSVKLEWSSVTEINNAFYDIERSLDNSNFVRIGTVQGSGTTSEKNSYEFVDQNITSGKYYYRLKQSDFDGTFTYSKVLEVHLNTPSSFALHQNYPNPFNPETRITFELPSESVISIRVFDMTGREAAVLAENVSYAPGIHSVDFNAGTFSSGIYLYSIQAVTAEGKHFTTARKMSLIK